MKIKNIPSIQPKVINNTNIDFDKIKTLSLLGSTISKWRQRNINLYQSPNDPENVISVGTTFDNTMIVVAEDNKSDWIVALDYASRGKVYVSE